jgi:pimeloyl-ACP methyl ester carboxylesterase
MDLHDIVRGRTTEGYREITLRTSHGDIECRYYAVPGAYRGVLWVGGVGGNFDTPARGLYPRLCSDLQAVGIASLRVRYRYPTVLEEAVLDALAGLTFLESEGIEAVALTGHSFGGAVVVQAGINTPVVRTVVTLSTQSYGAGEVGNLAPDCSILLLHGGADTVLPASASRYVYRRAHEPKRLIIYEGAHHGLDEVADQVYQTVHNWLAAALPGGDEPRQGNGDVYA